MRGQSGFVTKNSDIYGYGKILERTYSRIESSAINQENKQLILKFLEECLANGLSKARIIKYGATLLQLARIAGKPFESLKKEDILRIVKEVELRNYSEWTKRDYKIILKKFYRWLKGSEEYPEEVRWIRPRIKSKTVLPEEILTTEEVKLMAEKAENLRDKTFILVLYESGCRIGEILSLKLKHVQNDENGMFLIVKGKTGSRRVRILTSASILACWIENHPLKENPEAPLWVTLGTNHRYTPLKHATVRTILKKAALKAGIRKRIYPHLFRHSRATHLAKHLTEAQLKQFMGWVQGSRMASTYVHLSGRDLDEALLRINGVKYNGSDKRSNFRVISCPKCGQANSPISKFCLKCGSSLGTETKNGEIEAKILELFSLAVRNPDLVDKLINVIREAAGNRNLRN